MGKAIVWIGSNWRPKFNGDAVYSVTGIEVKDGVKWIYLEDSHGNEIPWMEQEFEENFQTHLWNWDND